VLGNIWVRGDYLCFWGQVCALFELKITNRSGKCEIAIDTAKIDEPARGSNPCFFG
jgi:hypothetical protein